MKTKKMECEHVETRGAGRWKVLPAAALLYVLAGSTQECTAKSYSSVDKEKIVTEVTQQKVQEKKDDRMFDMGTLIQQTPSKDEEVGDTGGEDEKEPEMGGGDGDDEKGEKVAVHGMARVGSDVTPLLGSVLSQKPAMLLSIDVSHPKTGLGLTVTRCDDFDKSMDSPASQMSIFDFYWQKQFGKASVMVDGEYTMIDKLPGAESFTPIVGCTYDAGKGWKLDAWGGHTFQKGKDGDIVRLGVTKMLAKSVSLATQAFYSSELCKKIYGRVQVDVKLGKGFGVQLSFIAKEGELTPTTGFVYQF